MPETGVVVRVGADDANRVVEEERPKMPEAMNQNILVTTDLNDPSTTQFEAVERKGLGHPDTLADCLAEQLSVAYARYTQERFGAVLRHQFDKLTLMCGRTEVRYGGGRQVEPVRILVNGRAAPRLGDQMIPLEELLRATCREFFALRFPMIEPDDGLRILYEVRHGTTGGVRGSEADDAAGIHFRFNPRTLDDMPETRERLCNDTSVGCAFAPYTPLEGLVLQLERTLNSDTFKGGRPWLGSDIKIMAHRVDRQVSLTIALPQMSPFVPSATAYAENLRTVRDEVTRMSLAMTPQFDVRIDLNTRDDARKSDLYLTWSGSSIEAGDEGQVGRGNRIGGLIAPRRPMSMEGICGKNPVYHTGKLYCVAAFDIAWRLHRAFDVAAEVYLIGQMGRPIRDPSQAAVRLSKPVDPDAVAREVRAVLDDPAGLTDRILRGAYPLC